ncbi:hypothetical protein J5U23_01664 [Saccharolobus shibatae B12]|uniref:Uncharacterized protein n=1 Tax=Saccharolobus shibatae (strain ATCC 51178 / DSM 5389 / JCM 8931 / NBRC 15437 / B12) TaxID=523848 RepID=A0A8F5BP65_SACSH|nr:hypothetical protein J5U23_01664 [Saccharolobus shibatae B12]
MQERYRIKNVFFQFLLGLILDLPFTHLIHLYEFFQFLLGLIKPMLVPDFSSAIPFFFQFLLGLIKSLLDHPKFKIINFQFLLGLIISSRCGWSEE